MNANLILLIYIIPMAFGALFLTPLGGKIVRSPLLKLEHRYPDLKYVRHQKLYGLTWIFIAGFAVSAHTLWISNKLSEGGSYCASASLFSCDDVIGNPQYNTDPLFGMSWGLLGMFAFATMLYFVRTSTREPHAAWVATYVKLGLYASTFGLAVIALLISYEIQMEKLCQYCSTAHAGNILGVIGFWQLHKLIITNEWKHAALPTPSESNSPSKTQIKKPMPINEEE